MFIHITQPFRIAIIRILFLAPLLFQPWQRERERGKEKNIDKKNDISIGDIPGGPAPAAAVKVEEIKKADRIIYANLHTLQGPQKSELISVESKIVDVVVVITSQTVLTLKKRDKFI